MLYRDNDQGEARIGFVIAKKKIPTAVARNRVRRVVRESFRQQRNNLGGIDIIILGQGNAGSVANLELFTSLSRHWQNLQEREDHNRRSGSVKDNA